MTDHTGCCGGSGCSCGCSVDVLPTSRECPECGTRLRITGSLQRLELRLNCGSCGHTGPRLSTEELRELLWRNERLKQAAETVERALGVEAKGPALAKELTERYADAVGREFLARRAQRALDYAERAQTALAYELALREMARQAEEEEMALLLILAA